ELAEHLAHFWRGDEIARRAERIARDVIAVLRMAQAKLHIAVDRDRPIDSDDAADLGFERRHCAAGAAFRGGRRNAIQMSAIPNTNSGSDSTIPMVKPPHRKPSWASGSRNSSANQRASA